MIENKLQKIAEGLNGIYPLVKELEFNLENEIRSEWDLMNDLFNITYIARRAILDRTQEFDGPLSILIIVPMISEFKITLEKALELTVLKLQEMSVEMGQEEEFEEIMQKGNFYWEIDSEIPEYLKSDFI